MSRVDRGTSRVEIDIRGRRGDFDFEIALEAESGEVTSVFGPSGSGKTTLLLALAGHIPAEGRIAIDGEDWLGEGRALPPHRRRIGWVSQESDLFSHLDVRRNLRFGLDRLAPADRQVGLDEIVDWLGLASLLDRGVADLSGGERQRVALGRALLSSPRLLLLDEPLGALDLEARRGIVDRLDELRDRFAWPVLLVSHSIREVARLADELILLEQGRVRDRGAVGDMLASFEIDRMAGEESGAVLDAVLEAHEEDGVCRLATSVGPIFIRRAEGEIGRRLRVQILASDLSLATGRIENDSVLNSIPGRVAEIEEIAEGLVAVRVLCQDETSHLLAHVTRRSLSRLGLVVGKSGRGKSEGRLAPRLRSLSATMIATKRRMNG